MMKPTAHWEPPPVRYQRLAARARELDSKTIVGVCCTTELVRMEKLVDQLERQAAEKLAHQPIRQAYAVLGSLWQRANQARNEIVRQQGEMKPHLRELNIIGVPAHFLDEPTSIGGEMPRFKSADECESFNSTFSHQVADLELLARNIGAYVQNWVKLTLDQQNRRLILALADRLK